MPDKRTSINIKETVRDELRRYKAEDGYTYDQAIARLLDEDGWIEEKSDLVEFDEDHEDENVEADNEGH